MLKALIIEDDEVFSANLKSFMEDIGPKRSFLRFSQVDCAYVCEQAIARASKGISYHFVFYDFQLPWKSGEKARVENGFPLVQQIRQLQRSACGILVSQFTGSNEIPILEQIGAVSRRVPKPASLQDILLVAEDAILEAARKTFEGLSDSYQEQAKVHEAMNSLNNILAAASEISRICSPVGEFILSRNLPLIREELENIRRFEQATEKSLRDLHVTETTEREPCNLPLIAEWCASYLRHQYPKQQDRLTLRVQGKLLPTLGVRRELEQLILLLATNALQATEDSGHATISLSFDTEGDGEILLAVEDDGPGIPSEILVRIFERDFTTRPGGSGQGLFLARAFVWNHGGRIQVESAEGGGTRVMVRLPVREVLADA